MRRRTNVYYRGYELVPVWVALALSLALLFDCRTLASGAMVAIPEIIVAFGLLIAYGLALTWYIQLGERTGPTPGLPLLPVWWTLTIGAGAAIGVLWARHLLRDFGAALAEDATGRLARAFAICLLGQGLAIGQLVAVFVLREVLGRVSAGIWLLRRRR